eukprot:3040914-Ditylum_brightwellii.AAC.1
MSVTVTCYAVTALHIRVVAYYDKYHVLTQTFGKKSKQPVKKRQRRRKQGFALHGRKSRRIGQ